MSNKQARAQADKVVLRHIILVMANGDVVPMDLKKVNIIERATGKPLFKDVPDVKQK